ncbi:Nucleoside-diphosphate kinase [Apodemus speciosus]|uniref:Nucleoside-diphosphate kinase n=1 Tax=Apodemus speciosus TaxID=105296 RepID=A0ABQ0FPS3_APOSI
MGLCESTLPQLGRSLRPQEKDILRYPLIIFVVGGPGCGKGTQCRNMAMKYGFYHVELGQLLREEAQRSTQRGRQIRDIMQKGLLLPTAVFRHPQKTASDLIIDGCEPSCGCWDFNSRPLEEQLALNR